MTWLREVAVPQLLGGISALLGGPPQTGPPPPDPRDLLTPEQKAQLTYAGVDPATAPIGDINRVLQGLGEKPLLPPVPPVSGSAPGPGAGPDGFGGDAAQVAGRVDDALQGNHSALNDADAQLTVAILRATASDQAGKARLRGLQQEVVDEVTKLGPTLDTPGGQAQLADFLQGKTAEVLDVVTTAGLDAASHAAVLDALTARYQALGSGRDEQAAPPADAAPPANAPPADAAPPANAPLAPDATVAPDRLPSDLIPDGLSSDPAPASGWYPQTGELGGLPGGGLPLGGLPVGGLPVGDLGASIGSAIRDAVAERQDQPPAMSDTAPSQDTSEAAPLKDQHSPVPKPPAGPLGPPAPNPPDTTVKLPDGTSATAASPAVAVAGRAVLAGTPIADAYQQAGITLPAPGSPVTAAVSPSQLVFGDVGEFADHQVMALGGGKVLVNGQVAPLEQLDTGPNFLGWEHPSVGAVANGR